MNCVILGTGVSGMVASLVLKTHGHKITAIGPDSGDFFQGGLKYFQHSPALEFALREAGVPYVEEKVYGGIFWENQLHLYPGFLRDSENGELRLIIMMMHYLKSRGTMDGFQPTCMNDPFHDRSRSLVINPTRMAQAAWDDVQLIRDMVVEVDLAGHQIWLENDLSVSGENLVEYDQLFTSLLAKAFEKLTQNTQSRETAVSCLFPDLKGGFVDLYRIGKPGDGFLWHPNYEYIYTPLQKMISRLSVDLNQNCSFVEVPRPHGCNFVDISELVAEEVRQVLGRELQISYTGTIKGHIVEIDKPLEYPDGVLPIGRYAAWSSRETADIVACKVSRWCDKEKK